MKKFRFTMPEIVMALGTFLVAFSPLLGVLTATTKTNVDSTNRIKSNVLASRELGKIRQLAWGNWNELVKENNSLVKNNQLKRDSEFPGLYYLVDIKEQDPNLARVQLGVAQSPSRTLLKNNAGSQIKINKGKFQYGNNVGGLNISPLQLRKYKKGGHVCVGNSTIIGFDDATSSSLVNTRGFNNTEDKKASGNVVYLDQVYTIWLVKKK